jgi:hypothetical protein
MIFEHFLAGLPDKYLSTQANIDAQQHFTVQDKLDILVIQKERLFTDKAEKALAAQSTLQNLYRPKYRSKYNSRSGSEFASRQNLIYWIYKLYRHLVQDCPILLQFQTIVKKLSTASLQIEKSRVQSSGSAKQKDKSVKDKTISVKPSSCCYKGYVANNNLSDTDTELPDTDSPDSDKEEEKAVKVAANSWDFGKVALS